jgi:Methyltransferase domain
MSTLAASYMSRSLQLYDEMTSYGLESRSPVDYIVSRGWGELTRDERILLPTQLNDTGGTRPEELLCPSYIDTDIDLVRRRPLARYIHELGLESRRQQILSDSKEFDPTPHEGTVEFGFSDGAHSHEYVKNDTEKMLRMITDRGIVMWHDYGGKGRGRWT